ncbi:MAG: Methyl-accepting chemotaxis protein [Candidatus Levybacteria bacterium]|nr:Methyl-accepting chemotaxis protein [Candidatus Levybacteria bacterium]
MLTELLFFNTFHFALTAFTAFVFFAAGLLYFDSWQIDKLKKTPLFRSIGFFLLAGVAATHASSLSFPSITTLAQIFKISGLTLIFFSLFKEPILNKPAADIPPPTVADIQANERISSKAKSPKTKKKARTKMALVIPFVFPAIFPSLVPLSAVLLLFVAISYFRKSTEGLEKQLKPAAFAFFLLALAEFTSISFFWSDILNVFWSKMLADFGFVWITNHLLELIGIFIFAIWIWGYIRFRLQIQLFITVVGATLGIFLVTTFLFTFLLLKNLEADALVHLKTDVNVLQYSLNRLRLETLANAKAIAQDASFKEAFSKNSPADLYKITSDFMVSQGASFLTVASSSGEVLMRAENRELVGDNLSEDPVAKSALAGNAISTIVVNEGITHPEVFVKAAVPIKGGGVVVTGFIVDSAFVDGVKNITGLDVAIFGGNKRAATTFVAPDGKSRFIGSLETNKHITDTVLGKGKIYVGSSFVLNQPYYTANAPLKTLGDETIGMLFVGKPQTTLMAAAQKSIDLTFLGSIVLMMLSIIPAYFLSRYLKEHAEA